MKYASDLFLFGSHEEPVTVGDGITRQILGYDDSILMARVCFEEDSVGYSHTHPHSQVTYVESGVFDFTIGRKTRQLATGDCAYIPPDVEHGAVCRKKGVLLDVFSPVREDFLAENNE